MEQEQIMADTAAPEPVIRQARQLLRGTRAGSLATNFNRQPYASLVTPACAPDFSVLLLLSDLATHTSHLRADKRCSLLVVGPAETANPQTAPRLTIIGAAKKESNPALKQRWLALHPYAAMYAGFADFSLWRITPTAGLIVGGFARAMHLKDTDLTPDINAVEAVSAAESAILSHCNTDHADALATLAGHPGDAVWRMVAVDIDGCDLASGDIVKRIDWSAPVKDADGVRNELVALVELARQS
jgi:putative heme iron utilization protein